MRGILHHAWRQARVVRLHRQPGPCRFHEEQHLPRLVSTLLTLVGGLAIGASIVPEVDEPNRPLAVGATIFGTAMLLFVALSLRILIDSDESRLELQVRPFFRRAIAVNDIAGCRCVTLVPPDNQIRGHVSNIYRGDFWAVQNRHGLHLVLRDGSDFFITTEHPERLANAIRESQRQIELVS